METVVRALIKTRVLNPSKVFIVDRFRRHETGRRETLWIGHEVLGDYGDINKYREFYESVYWKVGSIESNLRPYPNEKKYFVLRKVYYPLPTVKGLKSWRDKLVWYYYRYLYVFWRRRVCASEW